MAKRTGGNGKAEQGIAAGRREYLRPRLVAFGRLHLSTMGQGSGNADGNSGMGLPGMGMTMSDRRAKENVVRIGRLFGGISLYLFDYKLAFQAAHGSDRQFGVMADEVERFMPWAVSVGTDGYKRVNYALLGIRRGAC